MRKPVSNKEKGDKFRDKIRDLCIAAGYEPITEMKINNKDVDVVFKIDRLPNPSVVAIEAKSLKVNLQKKLADEIIGSYANAVSRRKIDEVWIVAEKDFTAEARDTLQNNPGFHAITYEKFLKSLINFPRYIENLRLQIEQDGILNYHVKQFFFNRRGITQISS